MVPHIQSLWGGSQSCKSVSSNITLAFYACLCSVVVVGAIMIALSCVLYVHICSVVGAVVPFPSSWLVYSRGSCVNAWVESMWMSWYCTFLQQEACVLLRLTIMDVSVALVGTRHHGGHSSLLFVFHGIDTSVLSCPHQPSMHSIREGATVLIVWARARARHRWHQWHCRGQVTWNSQILVSSCRILL